MADILPFPAIRPAPDKAPYVVSRSYETYSSSQRKYEMKHNPFSFLHVLNPGFKFHQKLRGTERFKGVRNRYLEFLEEGILVRDQIPAYYVYQSTDAYQSSFGIFCATSVHDYRNGVIRRHEDTLKKRENLFADYLESVLFNAEPVLMTYPHDPHIQELLSEVMERKPEYHFTTPDLVMHKMWIIAEPDSVEVLKRAFNRIPLIYIADGHHRCASSNTLSYRMEDDSNKESQPKGCDFFMSYLVDETQLTIGSFSRLVTDLNGLQPDEVLFRLDNHFRIHEIGDLPYEPEEKHSFGMYLDGSFYSLHLRKSSYDFKDPLSRLDSHILYKTILQPILGIKNARMDTRIAYRNSPQPGLDIKTEVESGRYGVGFSMLPVTLKEIREVSDAGQIMPPKTSYMQPKLRSGLTIYDIKHCDDHS